MTIRAARIVVALLALPSNALAQHRTFVVPSVAMAGVVDDNIFVTPSPGESDVVWRTTPSLRAGYVSRRFQLSGLYSCDAERYGNHHELDDALARQRAGIEVRIHPTRRLTVAADASYIRTNTPQELNLETGLAVARASAQGVTLTPSVTAQFSPRDRGVVSFEWTRDAFLGTPLDGPPASVDERALTFTFERQLEPTDAAVVDYQVRWFLFAGAPGVLAGMSGMSQVVQLGWDHKLTRLTDLTLRVGPRLSEGNTQPEWTAGLRQRMNRGEISLTLARSQSVALGEAGIIDTNRLALRVTTRPLRRLELEVGPGITRDDSPDGRTNATVGLLDASVSSALTEWLSLQASYHRALERGWAPTVGTSTIRQAVFILQIVAHTPGRQPEGI